MNIVIVKVVVPDSPSLDYVAQVLDEPVERNGRRVMLVEDVRGNRAQPNVEDVLQASEEEISRFKAERGNPTSVFGAIPTQEALAKIGKVSLEEAEKATSAQWSKAIENVKAQLKELNELDAVTGLHAQSRPAFVQNSGVTIALTDVNGVNKELVKLLCYTYSQGNLASFCPGRRWTTGLSSSYDPQITHVRISTIPIRINDGSMV